MAPYSNHLGPVCVTRPLAKPHRPGGELGSFLCGREFMRFGISAGTVDFGHYTTSAKLLFLLRLIRSFQGLFNALGLVISNELAYILQGGFTDILYSAEMLK